MASIVVRPLKTGFGELIIGAWEHRICLCDWRYRSMRNSIDKRITEALKSEYSHGNEPILDDLEDQLDEYFHGRRKEFDLPLLMTGSDFQKSVWTVLQGIRYGETETYAGLASRTGRPEAVRAVGSANGANAISIIIPCHRIVGSRGTLGGYAGGLNAKRKLLELESQPFLNWK